MPRRKRKITAPRIPSPVVKVGLWLFLVLGATFVLYKGVGDFAGQSQYFKVKVIHIDPTLQFIQEHDLSYLKGKSIFSADLKKAQRRLAVKYPQVAYLRIVRVFPDQISVVAKRRLPFAQIHMKHRILTIDKNGVLLAKMAQRDNKLFVIVPLAINTQNLRLGAPLGNKDIRIALSIARAFQKAEDLNSYTINTINVRNLSQIELFLTNKLKIITDAQDIKGKIRILGVVLKQPEVDLKKTKYIDLRFQEPVIGKK